MSLSTERRASRLERAGVVALYALVAALALATSHVAGDFWWPDASRHALNGLFVLDFVRAMPLQDPVGFAERYYVQYPALTVLFYPPLAHAAMAAAHALFGPSHAVAQATVIAFFAGVLLVCHAIARRYLPTGWAIAATLLFACAPQMLFWTRQVMVDTPALFFLLAAALALLRYTDAWQPRWVWWSAGAFVAAVYCKYNMAFAAPALPAALLAAGGARVLRRPHLLRAAAVSAVALLPALVLMAWFGRENVASVQGSLRDDLPASDPRAWLVYASFLPQQLGPLALAALAVGWLALAAARPTNLRAARPSGPAGNRPPAPIVNRPPDPIVNRQPDPAGNRSPAPVVDPPPEPALDRPPDPVSRQSSGSAVRPRRHGLARRDLWLWLTWLAVGYALFSYIKVREPRHTLAVLWPVVLLGTIGLRQLCARLPAAAGGLAACAAGAHALWAALAVPAPFVSGYADAAALVGRHGQAGHRVLFSGYRDGTFIYNMRVLAATRAMTTIRSDKLIARVSIERSRGIAGRGLDQAAMRDLFRRLAIRWVVAQPGFWSDLPYFRAFEAVLADRTLFEPLARVPVGSNQPVPETELVVYRYVGPLADPPEPVSIEIAPIGRGVTR